MSIMATLTATVLCVTMGIAPPATAKKTEPAPVSASSTPVSQRENDVKLPSAPSAFNNVRQPVSPVGQVAPLDGEPEPKCEPSGMQTWGTPANDSDVNQVPDRDPSPLKFELNSSCVLTFYGGTSPNWDSINDFTLAQFLAPATEIRFAGNTTLYSNRQNYTGLFSSLSYTKTVRVDGIVHLAGTIGDNLFAYNFGLTHFVGNGFETSQLTTAHSMFLYCMNLESVTIPDTWDVRKVTDMSWMFISSPNLKSVSLPTRWDTSNVTTFDSMFASCYSLESLRLPEIWNTGSATNMQNMFMSCTNLKNLTMPTWWDASNVTNMQNMFAYCQSLESLVMPTTPDTGNLTNISLMFMGCDNLRSLDISNMNTRNTFSSYGAQGSFPPAVQDIWLGPDTYLAETDDDYQVFQYTMNYEGWAEITETGAHIPAPDLRARTSLTSGKNPKGHYRIPKLVLTIDYNNGEANHTETKTIDTSNSNSAGSRSLTWGTRPAPAGKVFDGWKLTTSATGYLRLNDNTVSWDAYTDDREAKITATWRNVDHPAIKVIVHAEGSARPQRSNDPWAEVTVTEPEDSRTDDTITLESLNGEGHNDSCNPTEGSNQCTFRLSIAQLRDDDFESLYHLRAKITAFDRRDTETTVTGRPSDQEAILPYTTITYQAGIGAGGSTPATKRALTDTAAQNARLTVARPDTITRPANSLFSGWQTNHGSIRPGTTPVPVSAGDTDAQGRTTIALTAAWNTLATPDITSAVRESNGHTTITGTAKPLRSDDIVRICHLTDNHGRQCRDITPDTNASNGTTLPHDGTTEHPWKLVLTDSLDEGTAIEAFLVAKDTTYTDNPEVQSAAATVNTTTGIGSDNGTGTGNGSDNGTGTGNGANTGSGPGTGTSNGNRKDTGTDTQPGTNKDNRKTSRTDTEPTGGPLSLAKTGGMPIMPLFAISLLLLASGACLYGLRRRHDTD